MLGTLPVIALVTLTLGQYSNTYIRVGEKAAEEDVRVPWGGVRCACSSRRRLRRTLLMREMEQRSEGSGGSHVDICRETGPGLQTLPPQSCLRGTP